MSDSTTPAQRLLMANSVMQILDNWETLSPSS